MYPEKESSKVELKRELTDSFLKTVSAFANYGGGKIVFGISENGSVVGIVDPEKTRLQLEHKINDSISPRPEFVLNTRSFEEKQIVELTVSKGKNAPYLYNGRTYKRSDTSSTPLDSNELRKLSLDSSSMTFDQLPSHEEELSFKVLERWLQETVGLKVVEPDLDGDGPCLVLMPPHVIDDILCKIGKRPCNHLPVLHIFLESSFTAE